MNAVTEVMDELRRVLNERDEARTACPDCAMWAERSARWHDDMQRAERERDEARAGLARSVAAWESAGMQGRTAHDAMLALAKERDEARAEVEHAYREGGALYEAKIAEREAFRSGAEAMREACAEWISKHNGVSKWVYDDMLSDLPIPEEP